MPMFFLRGSSDIFGRGDEAQTGFMPGGVCAPLAIARFFMPRFSESAVTNRAYRERLRERLRGTGPRATVTAGDGDGDGELNCTWTGRLSIVERGGEKS